jgi:GH15 family glucan-1,4-alpha-glucosidase
MRTAALVGMNGSIDWLCFPHFDSPSVFAALLDDAKGGRFSIRPLEEPFTSKQLYWPDTNVLITRFLAAGGVGEVQDFLPAGPAVAPEWRDQLVRRVKVARGTVAFRVECRPAFDYARATHETRVTPNGAYFVGPSATFALATRVPLRAEGGSALAELVLQEGQSATFVLRSMCAPECGRVPAEAEVQELFERTVAFWRRWLSRCSYEGRWSEVVRRSALLLKLLTFEPTGAIVAAPTCSLPEKIGGRRNWDYRYTWIRDAAFTLYGLLRIGFTDEALGFMQWLGARSRESEELQIVYGIDGRRELPELTLDHLEGYRGSRPVRIGNGAASQLQLDIYGELLDAVYLFNKYGTPIAIDAWVELRRHIDWLCDNWERADQGIWEVRSGRQQFVYSKLMCWVAMDRALRLADKRSFPAPRAKWSQVRDAIYETILTRGWSDARQSFVLHFGSDSLDASNLIMPLVFFMSPADPRMKKTLEAIRRTPKEGGLVADSLVYRYDTAKWADGVDEGEGTFNICTFWLVEAMARAGRFDPVLLEDARLLFERMLGYANHLGLYAEQTGSCGDALGNFPQAFTHLALISAAYNLDRTLREAGHH